MPEPPKVGVKPDKSWYESPLYLGIVIATLVGAFIFSFSNQDKPKELGKYHSLEEAVEIQRHEFLSQPWTTCQDRIGRFSIDFPNQPTIEQDEIRTSMSVDLGPNGSFLIDVFNIKEQSDADFTEAFKEIISRENNESGDALLNRIETPITVGAHSGLDVTYKVKGAFTYKKAHKKYRGDTRIPVITYEEKPVDSYRHYRIIAVDNKTVYYMTMETVMSDKTVAEKFFNSLKILK